MNGDIRIQGFWSAIKSPACGCCHQEAMWQLVTPYNHWTKDYYCEPCRVRYVEPQLIDGGIDE